MSLLDAILKAGGGATVQQIGSQLGLGEQQTTSALAALIPVLAAGVQQNAQTPGGLASVLSAIASGRHQQYVDDPSTLGNQATIDDGNAILGHVLGSKDVSRQVANHAAAETGIGADVLKKMLPLAATLLMGALARRSTRTTSGGAAGISPGASPDLMDILQSTLGGAPQGGGMAGVAGMLGKMFGR
ncbi:MAG: DUF937 domain-containing protein [Acidobacteriota bacterium]